jgi:hypothetical protein
MQAAQPHRSSASSNLRALSRLRWASKPANGPANGQIEEDIFTSSGNRNSLDVPPDSL